MIALLGIVTVLLEYIDRLIPNMLTLCSMLLVTYYAFNYAGIISRGLTDAFKRRPVFSFTVGLKQLSTIVKECHYQGTGV